ncbi:MAG: TGS domain-containing protein [bacterium]|nr:TGS domain-containing protein [bacterium]
MNIEEMPKEVLDILKEIENSTEVNKIFQNTSFTIKDSVSLFRNIFLTNEPLKIVSYSIFLNENVSKNPYFVSRFLQTFFIPIIYRFGIYKLKNEIEEKIISYVYPKQSKLIDEFLNKKYNELNSFVEEFKINLTNALISRNINSTVNYRFKTKFQILREMLFEEKKIEELLKIFELMVTVEEQKIYSSIGVIHELFKPVPGGFKDYIAVPKHNGYRALHTLVINKGFKIEVIVYSKEMEEINNFGILKSTQLLKEAEIFLNDLITNIKGVSDAEFINALSSELEYEYVYVLTPKNDVVRIPAGSTLLDFAYKIHSEVGRKAIYGKVDGSIVDLNYILPSGCVCEVITSPNANPKPEHLKFVKTQKAKELIKKYLKE